MSQDLKERIEELLKSLGDDADGVAATLHGQDIVGHREDCWHCPIANLIARRVPGADRWKQEEWSVSDEYIKIPGRVKVYPPDAVAAFIGAFDGGRFPFLDVEAEDEP